MTNVSRLSLTRVSPRTRTAVVAGAILFGSLLPVSTLLSVFPVFPPSPETTTVSLFGVGVDKLVHALSYALLGSVAAAWRGRRRGVALVVVVCAVAAFGVGVEVAQTAVPGRTATVGDAVANFAGAAVGVGSWRQWGRSRDVQSSESGS